MNSEKSQLQNEEDRGYFSRAWYLVFRPLANDMPGDGSSFDPVDLTEEQEQGPKRNLESVDLTLSDPEDRQERTSAKRTKSGANENVRQKLTKSSLVAWSTARIPSPTGGKHVLPAELRSSRKCSPALSRKASTVPAKPTPDDEGLPSLALVSKDDARPEKPLFRHRPHSDQTSKVESLSNLSAGPSKGTDGGFKPNAVRRDGPIATNSARTRPSDSPVSSPRKRSASVAKGSSQHDPDTGVDIIKQSQRHSEARKSVAGQSSSLRKNIPRLPSRPPPLEARTSNSTRAEQDKVEEARLAKSQNAKTDLPGGFELIRRSTERRDTNSPASTKTKQAKAPIIIDIDFSSDSDTPQEPDNISNKVTSSKSSNREQVENSTYDAADTKSSPARVSPRAKHRLPLASPVEDSGSNLQDTSADSSSHLPPKGYTDSISSNSPLVERMRAKRSSLVSEAAQNKHDVVSPRREMAQRAGTAVQVNDEIELKVPELVRSLENLEQSAIDDHARNVRYLLMDARRISKNFTKPDYTDEISPFASMTALQTPAAQKKETKVIKLDTRHYRNKNLSRTKTVVPATTISTDVLRVPTYRDITNVKRTFLVCDKKNPEFFPLIGDTDPRKDQKMHEFRKEWERTYHGRVILRTAASVLEAEKARWLRPYFAHWLETLRIGFDEMRLIHHILKTQEVKPLKVKHFENAYKDRLSLDIPTQKKMSKQAEIITKAFDKAMELDMLDVFLPQARVNEIVKDINDINDKAENSFLPDRGLETYARLTCMICEVINCPTHGEYYGYIITCGESEVGSTDNNSAFDEAIVEEEEFLHDGIALTYEDLLRRHETRVSSKKLSSNLANGQPRSTPCSTNCYSMSSLVEQVEWPAEDIAFLESLLVTNSVHNNHLSCDLAVALDQPCWQVHQKMMTLKRPELKPVSPLKSRGKPLDWYQPAKKSINKKEFEHTTSVGHENRAQWRPCAHDGPCVETCSCVQANLPCELLCGCQDNCIRKFTGCSCASRGQACVTQSCICIRLYRECGPQCSSCGALPRLDPKNRFNDELFLKGCQNVAIQRNVHKRVLLGKSGIEVAGYGLYLAEPAKRGQFIGDYTGELITQEEAERRGCLYDHVSKSFLFTLNRDMIIDAARLGNQTRYINHARDAQHGLNCGASVRFVNGEHRIKFIAERDIAAGEELFFDYGKAFADKQGLNGTIPKKKASGSKKRSIEEVYDEEEEENDDEEEEEEEEKAPKSYVGKKKGMREETQAMLGLEGHARKARKLAPGLRKAIRGVERERSYDKEVEMQGAQETADADEEMEEEEEDEIVEEGDGNESSFDIEEEGSSSQVVESEEEEEEETPKKRVKRRPVRFRDEI